MNTLFPLEPVLPAGFSYFANFITKEEEGNLLEEISKISLRNLNFQGYEAKRKVASFGFDWSFTNRVLTRGQKIPEVFTPLVEKAGKYLNIPVENIAELLLTEYPVGSVINWHRDAPPFDTIVGISLLSDCTFRFRPYNKSQREKWSLRTLVVERRSLYVIQGPARSEWEHSISPVKNTRFSITLRTLKDRLVI